MKIADVFNEKSKEYYRQENASEYAYITADEYQPEEVILMEKQMIGFLDFNLFSPGSAHFLNLYMRVIRFENEKTFKLASFLTDMLLINYEALKFPNSLLASACLYISTFLFNDRLCDEILEECSAHFDWYTPEELGEAVSFVKSAWMDSRFNPQMTRYEAVHHKYQDEGFEDLQIAQVPVTRQPRWFYSSPSDMDLN